MLDALVAVRAEAFTLGQPDTAGGPDLGTPNTFVYAIAGVGGAPFCENDGDCNDGNPCTDDVCDATTHTCRSGPPGAPDADGDGVWDACDPCPLDPQNDGTGTESAATSTPA